MSKLSDDNNIEVDLSLEELGIVSSESKATYENIKEYILKEKGFKVSNLNIAQTKQKYGIIERENYNLGEGKSKVPSTPKEKEDAIVEAFKHYQMI